MGLSMVQMVGLLVFLQNVEIWEQDIWLIKEHFGFGFDEYLEIGFSLLIHIMRRISCREVRIQNLHL